MQQLAVWTHSCEVSVAAAVHSSLGDMGGLLDGAAEGGGGALSAALAAVSGAGARLLAGAVGGAAQQLAVAGSTPTSRLWRED
jgi:hypothetical protein